MKCVPRVMAAVTLALVFLSGSIHATEKKEVKMTATDSATLRKELEASYQKFRATFTKPTGDEFAAAVEAHGEEEKVKGIKAKWSDPQVKKGLSEFMFGDFAKTKFLEVRQSGDLAGYYSRFDEEDGSSITIEVTRFKKVEGQWKPMMKKSMGSVPKEANESANVAAVKDMLETSDTLKLDKK